MNKLKQLLIAFGRLFKKPLFLIVTTLVLALIGGVGSASWKFYGKGWEDKTSLIVAKTIPFPAVLVNYRPISIAEYRMRGVDFTKRFYTQQRGADYLNSDEGKAKILQKKRDFLDIVIEEEFVREYSSANKLKVNSAELEENYKKLVAENGGQAAFEKSLREDYLWSVEYFKKILAVNLLRQKIENKLCEGDSAEAKQKAEETKTKLLSGTKFEVLSGQLSDDPATAGTAGKLPPFSKDGLTLDNDLIDSAIVDFANRASEGEVDVVKTCQGYSVVRLDKKSGDQREVSHILSKIISYEDLLSEFRDRSKITILLPDFYFSKDQKAVFPRK